MSILKTPLPILSKRNPHPRDERIHFFEEGHRYTIDNDPSKYTSVTTLNHKHFPEFDANKVIDSIMNGKKWNETNPYWGMTPDEIKQQWKNNGLTSSQAGTAMHLDIECFMNQDLVDEYDNPADYNHEELLEIYNSEPQPETLVDEWVFFLKFVKDTPLLKPYRTEWLVYYEELKIAGSIDMVYENIDGSLILYDWKRAKEIKKTDWYNSSYATTQCISHIPNTNFWHYSLQLNTYKAILEAKYNKKVSGMYLVKLHPNNTGNTYILIKCADLSTEINDLFRERREYVTSSEFSNS